MSASEFLLLIQSASFYVNIFNILSIGLGLLYFAKWSILAVYTGIYSNIVINILDSRLISSTFIPDVNCQDCVLAADADNTVDAAACFKIDLFS